MTFNFKDSQQTVFKILFLFFLTLALSNCASPTKYYWGSYEPLIYSQYQEPGKATPDVQIQKMLEDIQRASSENQPLPPGFYAHLGYQYLQTGKAAEARQYFIAEKNAYPESAVLMDRFLKKIK